MKKNSSHLFLMLLMILSITACSSSSGGGGSSPPPQSSNGLADLDDNYLDYDAKYNVASYRFNHADASSEVLLSFNNSFHRGNIMIDSKIQSGQLIIHLPQDFYVKDIISSKVNATDINGNPIENTTALKIAIVHDFQDNVYKHQEINIQLNVKEPHKYAQSISFQGNAHLYYNNTLQYERLREYQNIRYYDERVDRDVEIRFISDPVSLYVTVNSAPSNGIITAYVPQEFYVGDAVFSHTTVSGAYGKSSVQTNSIRLGLTHKVSYNERYPLQPIGIFPTSTTPQQGIINLYYQ